MSDPPKVDAFAVVGGLGLSLPAAILATGMFKNENAPLDWATILPTAVVIFLAFRYGFSYGWWTNERRKANRE